MSNNVFLTIVVTAFLSLVWLFITVFLAYPAVMDVYIFSFQPVQHLVSILTEQNKLLEKGHFIMIFLGMVDFVISYVQNKKHYHQFTTFGIIVVIAFALEFILDYHVWIFPFFFIIFCVFLLKINSLVGIRLPQQIPARSV